MLADDIAAALPELRAQAESLMRDTVKVTTSVPGAWNDTTGTYDPPDVMTHYEGKARIRAGNPAPQTTDSGETAWSVDRVILSVPVSVTTIMDGMDVEVTAVGAGSSSIVGQHLTVLGGHAQTDSTARRFPCQVVSHDA